MLINKSFLGALIAFAIFAVACENTGTSAEGDTSKTAEEAAPPPTEFKKIAVNYPSVFRDTNIIDNYHGKQIVDPYRWLEDENAANTKAWVKAQNATTNTYLDAIPYRDRVQKRLEKMWNYERISPPFIEGGKYYFFKNDGLQNQSVLYVQDSPEGEATVVLDPNTFSEDGTVSLGGISFSKDGRYLAYQTSTGGSDWRKAQVKDLQTGKMLEDELDWLKFTGISWKDDGFYYSRYPEPKGDDALSGANQFQQVYYHKLGTAQEDDELVFADRSNPNRGFSSSTTDDEQFLVLSIWETTSGNGLYFKDLSKLDAEMKVIRKTLDADINVVGSHEGMLYALTNYKAPNQRLLAISANQPEEKWWQEVIPESEDVLEGVYMIGGKLVAQYMHNAVNQLKVYDLEGKEEGEIELPGLGTIGGMQGKKDQDEAYFSFTSFINPSSVYKLDIKSRKTSLFKAPQMDFDPEKYITKQVWYKNKFDGTPVPMFITHKKGLEMDGKRPTLLYGYGGFNISIQPGFSITRAYILENDGIYAVPNIRGGGEFGQEWHKSGTLERKQNVFNDFISAAEYLIDSNYTTSDKLAIQGRSNGGLLVGACMTQRPDLFAVAFPGVGVLDMLRYHEFTIGKAWAGDYGLSTDPKAFDYLISYSPLHNVEKAAYPATLVTTADHDDRVVPAHSFKFISELQKQHTGEAPVLIRIETSAGHGAGTPVSKQIEEATDWLSFMFYNMKEEVR